MYYTEKTVGMFQSLFKCLMFDQNREFDSLEQVAREIKGCTVRVKLKHEQYEDAQGNKKTAERVHYFMQSQKPLMRPSNGGVDEDPFAGNGQLDIGDDDLPF
jgi:single-stranded DNA-binding protein